MDTFEEISQSDFKLLEELVNTYGDDPIIAELLPSTTSSSVFEYQVNNIPVQTPVEQLFYGFTWEPVEPAYAQPIPVQPTPVQPILPPLKSNYAPVQLSYAPEFISSSTKSKENHKVTNSSSMFLFLFRLSTPSIQRLSYNLQSRMKFVMCRKEG